MAYLKGFSQESLFSLKNCTWETRLLEQCPLDKQEQSWDVLVMLHSTMFGENQAQRTGINTVVEGTLHCVHNKLLWLLKLDWN